MSLVSLQPRCQALHLPKRGNSADEYEDAWAADPDRGRFAVADGASESTYAALWSRLLVESFVAARRPWNELHWVDESQHRWAGSVDALDLPWYAEMKREQGAFATLLFRMSSQLPPRLQEAARGDGFRVGPMARGFVFNADLVAIVRFLDIGTRVAQGVR